jgi:hypothetical protein
MVLMVFHTIDHAVSLSTFDNSDLFHALGVCSEHLQLGGDTYSEIAWILIWNPISFLLDGILGEFGWSRYF